MLVRYFCLDEADIVFKISQRRIEAAFLDGERWDQNEGTTLLRIVSFICDDNLRPLRGFVMKLEAKDGHITRTSHDDVVAAYFSMLPPIEGPQPTRYPLVDKQLEGWPDERKLFPQLTAALDVPIDQMPRLYFGGPLLMAQRLGVSVKQGLTYYDLQHPAASDLLDES